MFDAKRTTVLIASMLSFAVCFVVWIMFGLAGIPIREQLGLDFTQIDCTARAHRSFVPTPTGHVDAALLATFFSRPVARFARSVVGYRIVLTSMSWPGGGYGIASTLKYISNEFPDTIGAVSGIAGLAGGLGGFLLPIMFRTLLDWLRINSSCIMLLYGIVVVSSVLNYLTEVRGLPVMGEKA